MSNERHLMLARIGWAEIRLTANKARKKQYALEVVDVSDGSTLSLEYFQFFEDSDAAFAVSCTEYHRLIVDERGMR